MLVRKVDGARVLVDGWRSLRHHAPRALYRGYGKHVPGRVEARSYFPRSWPWFIHSCHLSIVVDCPPLLATMVRGIEGNEMSTPRASSQKKQPPSGSQSGKNQKSILGFFQRKDADSPSPGPATAASAKRTPTSSLAKKAFSRPTLTPQPSSDAAIPSSPIRAVRDTSAGKNKENGPPSPASPPDAEANRVLSEVAGVLLNSPSRKVCSHSRHWLAATPDT